MPVPSAAPSEITCRVGGVSVRFRSEGSVAASLQALVRDYDQIETTETEPDWVLTVSPQTMSATPADSGIDEIIVGPSPLLTPTLALQQALFSILLATGRVPIHAALVTPSADSPGVLLVGDSGHGKSSLVFLAVSRGWKVVSDDLVALHESRSGAVTGATIRKKLRIAAHLVDAHTRSRGRATQPDGGIAKLLFDPDALRPGAFLSEAPISSFVFLERGASRSAVGLSSAGAFERLISSASVALAATGMRASFDILSALGRKARARVLRLTKDCLTDPDVLQELAA